MLFVLLNNDGVWKNFSNYNPCCYLLTERTETGAKWYLLYECLFFSSWGNFTIKFWTGFQVEQFLGKKFHVEVMPKLWQYLPKSPFRIITWNFLMWMLNILLLKTFTPEKCYTYKNVIRTQKNDQFGEHVMKISVLNLAKLYKHAHQEVSGNFRWTNDQSI